MMKQKLIIRPEAESDIQEAYAWYEDQSKGLGADFILCVDAALSLIQRSPELYAQVHKNIRRALTRRFPYGIFYIAEVDKIIVLAVLHVKRNPKHWQKRQ